METMFAFGTYHITTYGCQMNIHDSEKIAGMLEEMGYTAAGSIDEAHIIIFNTCCVRDHAEQKVFGNVGALKKRKQENPNLVVAVCGCMMQQPGAAQSLMARMTHVDFVFGTNNLKDFPAMLEEALEHKTRFYRIEPKDNDAAETLPIKRAFGYSAYATVMYGCDNFCSYCIVPYVRGRERSKPVEDVLSEVRTLANSGVKEVTLLGQNVNSYGKKEGYIPFAQLLHRVCKIDGIERVRFLTSHPKDISTELMEAIAQNDKVAKHLHLPVQSGSNRVLAAMNRHYTAESYLSLLQQARKIVGEIGLSTDMIVGFPGETEEEFAQTLQLVEQAQYNSAYMYAYSVRTGTVAAKTDGHVEKDVIKERLNRLIAVQNAITNAQNKALVGRKFEVLPVNKGRRNTQVLTGLTTTGRTVAFEGEETLLGKMTEVAIKGVRSNVLWGEVVPNN